MLNRGLRLSVIISKLKFSGGVPYLALIILGPVTSIITIRIIDSMKELLCPCWPFIQLFQELIAWGKGISVLTIWVSKIEVFLSRIIFERLAPSLFKFSKAGKGLHRRLCGDISLVWLTIELVRIFLLVKLPIVLRIIFLLEMIHHWLSLLVLWERCNILCLFFSCSLFGFLRFLFSNWDIFPKHDNERISNW